MAIKKYHETWRKNIINSPLVDRKSIILPPSHIKLGLMEQFVKALDRSRDCFGYVCSTFPGLSYEKKKAEKFDGPQIRTLLQDNHFVTTMTAVETRACKAFADVVHNFLGNKKAENYTRNSGGASSQPARTRL